MAGQGNRWWGGKVWAILGTDHVRDEISAAKFKSAMGHRLQIAREHSATLEPFSNTPIPPPIKSWLTRKGIPCTELLE